MSIYNIYNKIINSFKSLDGSIIYIHRSYALTFYFIFISFLSYLQCILHTMHYVLRYSIPYTAIQSATSQRRMFHLIYLSLDGEETSLDFKLDSSQSASGLYRAITEKHAFYSCETVRSAVTAQFIRDLKVRRMKLVYHDIIDAYALFVKKQNYRDFKFRNLLICI